jgi:hypothetical protein
MLLLFSRDRAFSDQLRHSVSSSYVRKCQLRIFVYPTREADIGGARVRVFSDEPRLILHDLVVAIVDAIIDIINIKLDLHLWLIILNIINVKLNLLIILQILVRLDERKVYRLNIIHSLASEVNSIISILLLVIIKKGVLATPQLFSS